jgi:hypothetical protein
MAFLWARIVNVYYRTHKCSGHFQNITLSMFCDPKEPRKTFPKLKGKAAEIKHLMPALLWAWRNVMTAGNTQHGEIEVLLQCSAFMDECMDKHRDDDVMPADVSEQFKQAGFALNACMNSLQSHYRSRGAASEYLFNIVPKNHYLAHIALSAAYLNPRMAACYMGEDMMHQMRRLSAGCARGNGPKNAGNKLVTWYAHGLSRLLSDTHGSL